jgi:hypothetical protein
VRTDTVHASLVLGISSAKKGSRVVPHSCSRFFSSSYRKTFVACIARRTSVTPGWAYTGTPLRTHLSTTLCDSVSPTRCQPLHTSWARPCADIGTLMCSPSARVPAHASEQLVFLLLFTFCPHPHSSRTACYPSRVQPSAQGSVTVRLAPLHKLLHNLSSHSCAPLCSSSCSRPGAGLGSQLCTETPTPFGLL